MSTRRVAVALVLVLAVSAVVLGAVWQVSALNSRVAQLETSLTQVKKAGSSFDEEIEVNVGRLETRFGSLYDRVSEITEDLPPDIPKLIARARESIVTVELSNGAQGSGFAVDLEPEPGFTSVIVTNHHVIEDATFVGGPRVFINQGGSRYEAELTGWDETNDLAVLDVLVDLPPLEWATDYGHKPSIGDFVIAIEPVRIGGYVDNRRGLAALSQLHPDRCRC